MKPTHTVSIVGAIVVSVVVLMAFAAVSLALFIRAIPPESHDVALVMFGALASMATAVVAFWTGTSIGSQRKDAMMEATRGQNQ